MAAILIGWTEDGGDLQRDSVKRIVRGPGLVTELLVSLNTDRPPDLGDPTPELVTRRKNWQLSFDRDALPGSKLWLIPYVRPIAKALVLAPIWAEEACLWLVTTKRVLSIDHTAERRGSAIRLAHNVRVDAKTWRKFITEVPYGV